MIPVPVPIARTDLPAGLRFEGHAIVSADGMIASADGGVPDGLHNAADWRHFQAALDRSALVVLGRLGHQRHPNPGRRRLVFTSTVAGIVADSDDPLSTLFNPAATLLGTLLEHLALTNGTIAVTGGTRVFEYFLPLYDRFRLAEVHDFVLSGGRPCFIGGHPRSRLAAAGLKPKAFSLIDPDANVTLTTWER